MRGWPRRAPRPGTPSGPSRTPPTIPPTCSARANQIILAEEFSGRFVTACTAHLQWRDGSLEVALGSAGHPAPLLLRPDGQLRQLRGGGLPLGIFPDAGPGLEQHELSAGDTLIFYSDGLADAHRPGRGYFDDQLPGEVGALAGRAPGQILARLQEVALEFCQGKAARRHHHAGAAGR